MEQETETIDELRQRVESRLAETAVPPTTPEQLAAVAEANALDPEYAGGRRAVEQIVAGHGNNKPEP